MARPTGASHAPERLSALRPPLFPGERSKGANPRAQKTRRGNEEVLFDARSFSWSEFTRSGVVMSAAKKRTRAEEELAAAEQRRLAPVLREAHARLGLWPTCDHKTCRPRRTSRA